MTSTLTGFVKVGNHYPVYVTANTTLVSNEYDRVVALLSAPATLTLPLLSTCFNGYELLIRNNSAGATTLTVAGNGSDVIGSSSTVAVTQNQGLRIMCDHVHARWQVLFGPA